MILGRLKTRTVYKMPSFLVLSSDGLSKTKTSGDLPGGSIITHDQEDWTIIKSPSLPEETSNVLIFNEKTEEFLDIDEDSEYLTTINRHFFLKID